MAMMSKTRNILEGFMKEGSFKWVLGGRTSIEEEFEQLGRSPSGQRKWMIDLSPMANVVIGRCSRILDLSMDELRESFDRDASDSVKHPSQYARNFLEYCCFRALALSSQVTGHLGDKHFQRLTYDMMLAWEAPAAASTPLPQLGVESAVGKEAFSRIAPAIPTISDVVTSDDLFDALTIPTGGRLPFSVYEKYLRVLERVIKKMKTQSESSLLSALRLPRGERILDLDGTITTQPVLQHVGISTWPGRLILTDHALYFEPLKVVSYDEATMYDLSENLRQVVKPELTGPWGTRLFDKAVMYKSINLSEPVVMEFPELTGHSRRDYWLAIIREILYAHTFIRTYRINGVEREEALSKAVLGVMRLQAIQEITTSNPFRHDSLLMFNLADQLPGGDLILETFASVLASRKMDRGNNLSPRSGLYSVSALATLSTSAVFGTTAQLDKGVLLVGEISVGKTTSLEKVVRESRNSFKKVELAQATVDGVKVEGIDTNLAVMKDLDSGRIMGNAKESKGLNLLTSNDQLEEQLLSAHCVESQNELLFPITELGKHLLFLATWDDPIKSLTFCSMTTYVIWRGWISHIIAMMVLFMAIFMLLTRLCNQGNPVDQVKVLAPPAMNTMEQLLAVQNAISQIEELVQDGNVVLLKLRALMFDVFPQATEKVVLALLITSLALAFIPGKYIILCLFLESFTRYSPPRKVSTDRWMRRFREWWFSIPAAPVVLEGVKEEKKKKR